MSFQMFNTVEFPELVNPSDSAGQFLAGAFVVFVTDIKGLGYLGLKLLILVCLVLK